MWGRRGGACTRRWCWRGCSAVGAQATRPVLQELGEVSAGVGEHTLLALPIDAGFASALVSAVATVCAQGVEQW